MLLVHIPNSLSRRPLRTSRFYVFEKGCKSLFSLPKNHKNTFAGIAALRWGNEIQIYIDVLTCTGRVPVQPVVATENAFGGRFVDFREAKVT